MASILDHYPQNFLVGMRKRLIKCIYTNSLVIAVAEDSSKTDQFRVNALKIAAKFYEISKLKGKDDYAD